MSTLLPTSLCLISLYIAAYTDYRTGLIPNWCTISSLTAACIYAFFLKGFSSFLSTLLAVALVGGIPACLYWINQGKFLGGGDVKVISATGAWLGIQSGLEVLLLSLLLLLTFVLLRQLSNELLSFYRGIPRSLPPNRSFPWRQSPLPLGPALACSASFHSFLQWIGPWSSSL